MANSLIGNSAVATHMYQALYGQAASNGLYNSYIDSLAATSPAAFAATLAGNFANVSDSALALQVLNNLGVTATTVTATGEYDKLLTALGQAFAAFPTQRGQVILNATNLFANLEGDATYGASAVTYNKQALANFTYASNTANTAPGVAALPDPTVGSTFTLTAGVDTFTGGAGNDTFVGNTSLNAMAITSLDSINGGAGTNSLIATVTGTLDTTGAIGLSVSNVQSATLTSSATVTTDTTAWTGLTALTTNGVGAQSVTAAATTDVVTAGVTVAGNSETVAGGKNLNVTFAGITTAGAINIGTSTTAGTITASLTEANTGGVSAAVAQ